MSPNSAFLLSALAGSALAGFAPATWDTNQSNMSPAQTIVHVETTLTVPDITTQGLLLWPGMYTTDGDLVQTLLVNDPAYLEDYCGNPGTNVWCVLAYELEGSTGQNSQGTIVNPGDQIHIVYDNANGQTTQTASVGGNTIASITQPSGPGYRFSDTTECHANVGATPQITYSDTTITLSGADPSFNSALNARSSTPTSFSSTDGGVTWYIQTITLDPSTCECNASGNC